MSDTGRDRRRALGRWREARPRRRASWLDRDLRTRRQHLLRARWRELAVTLGAFAVSGALAAFLLRAWSFWSGVAVGTYLGAVTVLVIVMLAIADGSLFPRLGRALEDDAGTALLSTPGVFDVVSGVSFEHVDVDHVVLAPAGCFAVEVKASFSRRGHLDRVLALDDKLAQARDGARRIERLLASRGVAVPVSPVLVLTGSGAPEMTSPERRGDVLVLPLRDNEMWRAHLADLPPVLDEPTAHRAAAELAAYRAQRTEHELSNHRRR